MSTRVFTDMIGKEVTIGFPPMRIVSLVPSQTELLYDLGLNEEVVGITKFCVHPNDWFRTKKRIGGTKTLHLDIIRSLQPDLIIANKEENTKEQVEELAIEFPVWTSDIQTLEHALAMITQVGQIVGRSEQAQTLLKEIRHGFNHLARDAKPKRVAYFIWRNPWMSVGGDTFINDMIQKIGWINVFSDKQRYPEINLQDLKEKNVDTVLLSSEPYPFKDIHIAEIKAVLPKAEVMLVDGEMFSWYGSRMKKAIDYFKLLTESQ